MPKQNTYYFSHDYEPTSDPKIAALIGEYGGLGYGIFWRIVEMLHSSENNKLENKKYIFAGIAKQMLTTTDIVENIINYCIETCELLKTDDKYFWSNRVYKNIEFKKEMSEKKSKAGKISAQKRAASVQQMSASVQHLSTGVQHNPTNKIKSNEIKGNKNSVSVYNTREAQNGTHTHAFDFSIFLKRFYNDNGYIEKILSQHPDNKPNDVKSEMRKFVKRTSMKEKSLHPKNEKETLASLELWFDNKNSILK